MFAFYAHQAREGRAPPLRLLLLGATAEPFLFLCSAPVKSCRIQPPRSDAPGRDRYSIDEHRRTSATTSVKLPPSVRTPSWSYRYRDLTSQIPSPSSRNSMMAEDFAGENPSPDPGCPFQDTRAYGKPTPLPRMPGRERSDPKCAGRSE